jgi:hypothetical protein
MRYLSYFIIIFGIVIIGCDKDKNTVLSVNTDNQPEELSWIEEMKSSITNCTCQKSIFQGTYNNETVYFILMNDPLCNSVFDVVLYDSNGKVVKHYEYTDISLYCKEVTIVKSIYNCKE